MPSTRSTDEIMSSFKAAKALSFQHIDRSNLASLSQVQIDDSQLDWFAPVSEIISEAAANPARIPMAIRAGGDLIGFFIFHRDRRDSRCWWLAWYLIDKRQQGLGYGKAAFKRILAHLARIEGCLRIRLQVTPGNDAARSIYDRQDSVTPASRAAMTTISLNLSSLASRHRCRLTAAPAVAGWPSGRQNAGHAGGRACPLRHHGSASPRWAPGPGRWGCRLLPFRHKRDCPCRRLWCQKSACVGISPFPVEIRRSGEIPACRGRS